MREYDRQIATAQRLIKKNGQAVIWRSLKDGAPDDTSKPWKPSQATFTDKPVNIVFLPVSREDRELVRYLKGTEVQTGEILGFMGAVCFEPSIKDVIIRNGEELTISNIDIIAPNGNPILYVLEFGA